MESLTSGKIVHVYHRNIPLELFSKGIQLLVDGYLNIENVNRLNGLM